MITKGFSVFKIWGFVFIIFSKIDFMQLILKDRVNG